MIWSSKGTLDHLMFNIQFPQSTWFFCCMLYMHDFVMSNLRICLHLPLSQTYLDYFPLSIEGRLPLPSHPMSLPTWTVFSPSTPLSASMHSINCFASLPLAKHFAITSSSMQSCSRPTVSLMASSIITNPWCCILFPSYAHSIFKASFPWDSSTKHIFVVDPPTPYAPHVLLSFTFVSLWKWALSPFLAHVPLPQAPSSLAHFCSPLKSTVESEGSRYSTTRWAITRSAHYNSPISEPLLFRSIVSIFWCTCTFLSKSMHISCTLSLTSPNISVFTTFSCSTSHPRQASSTGVAWPKLFQFRSRPISLPIVVSSSLFSHPTLSYWRLSPTLVSIGDFISNSATSLYQPLRCSLSTYEASSSTDTWYTSSLIHIFLEIRTLDFTVVLTFNLAYSTCSEFKVALSRSTMVPTLPRIFLKQSTETMVYLYISPILFYCQQLCLRPMV